MKCPKCQTENPTIGNFCHGCGAKLLLVCTECNAENSPGDRFCGECGKQLDSPQTSSPIDYSRPQTYTPKFLADKILTSRSSIEGERKLVTVLFADVANYTSVAEKLDPEEVHQIMDGCFRILMNEIHGYDGTINQFTGDGVMALFGAPLAHEDHAQRACYAALSFQKALADYGERVKKQYGMNFQIRVGLNSGPVVVGSIGDDLRMDYTAIGDTTNLASRMQTMAKPGGVLVSAQTYKLCKDYFEFKPLGKLQVKGKQEPQEAFELIQTGIVKTRFGASVAKGLTPFAGRKTSMAALMGPYEEVKAGSGQVVGIMGEPGVGKSRLLLEFRNLLPKDEYGYLEGRCLQYGSSTAYLPMLDLLRGYFDIKAGEPEPSVKKKIAGKAILFDEQSRETLIPIQDLLSLQVEDNAYLQLEPKQKKEKIFEALRGWLIKESEHKSLIIAIEDLHWIDKTTEEFFGHMVGWVPNAKILLLLLYRPEYVPPWANQSNYHRIALNQLNPQTSSELVKAILKEGEPSPEILDLILGKAEGNPLFMEELTGSLLENGTIQKKNHQYVLSGKASEIVVPDTIQGIIAARMDRLEENLKRIMQAASVIGREFAFRILQAILKMREELKSHLLTLQRLELIYEKRLYPELEYIFKHALIQEVAYGSLFLKRRKEIHEDIGKAIEELYQDRLEEFYEMLAYHYSRSDNLDKAFHYLKLSGNKSNRNNSLWEAYRFYAEALGVLRQIPESEQRKKEQIETIFLMTVPMRLLGYPEDSIDFLKEGEMLCKELGDKRSIANLYSFMNLYYSVKGDLALSRKYLEDAFVEGDKIQDIEIMAPCGYGLCFSYLIEGDFIKVNNIAPKVIALLEKTHRENEFFGMHGNPHSMLHVFNGCALSFWGEFEQGEQLCEKGIASAHRTNHPYSIGLAYYNYGNLYLFKGDGEKVIKIFQSAIEYQEKSHSVIFLATAWGFQGAGYYLIGEYDTAIKLLEKGIKMQTDMKLPFLIAFMQAFLSMVHFDLGDFNQANAHAELAVKLAQTNREKWIEGFSCLQLGRVIGRMEGSQLQKAEECIFTGMKILENMKIKPSLSMGFLFLGELYAHAGLKEKSMNNLKQAEGLYQEMGMTYWLGRTKKVLETLKNVKKVPKPRQRK